MGTFLEPIKKASPWITYSDLWTLAAVVAVSEMGGPNIPWQGGRTDFTDDSRVPPRGRLPDGSKGADHLRWIFYRMGFDDREIVALSGAHNLGRCHSDRSGFEGKWVNNPTRFSNTYFKLLKMHDWKKKVLANGLEQYVYVDEDLKDEDPRFRVWVDRYAEDKDLFFRDFAAVFAKLLELGIQRDVEGRVVNEENLKDGYRSAPKKRDSPGRPERDQNEGQVGHEARRLKRDNEQYSKKENSRAVVKAKL